MSLDLTDDKSTLVQVMAWCRQATSHYLSQCWLRSVSPYGVIRPQWVKMSHPLVTRSSGLPCLYCPGSDDVLHDIIQPQTMLYMFVHQLQYMHAVSINLTFFYKLGPIYWGQNKMAARFAITMHLFQGDHILLPLSLKYLMFMIIWYAWNYQISLTDDHLWYQIRVSLKKKKKKKKKIW